MDEAPEHDVIRTEGAVRIFGWYGEESLTASAAAFAEQFYATAGSLGLSVEADPFDDDLTPFGPAGAHAARHSVPDKGVADQDPIALTVVVFLSLELTKWAVAKVADGLWAKIAPAFGRLRGAVARRPHTPAAPSRRVVVRTVYGADQVVVELEADLDAIDEDRLVGLLAEVQHRSLDVASGAADGVRVLRFEATADGVAGPAVLRGADTQP